MPATSGATSGRELGKPSTTIPADNPFVHAYLPDTSYVLVGAQTRQTYHPVSTVPSLASASTFGVLYPAEPRNPTSRHPRSSTTTSSTEGLLAAPDAGTMLASAMHAVARTIELAVGADSIPNI